MNFETARDAYAALRGRGETSFFEFWPRWLFYLPVTLQWIVLGLRYGSQSLPALADPLIERGGLCGESKQAILDQIKEPARSRVAPYVCFANTGDAHLAFAAMEGAGLTWPVVAKPDIGCNGTGVRLLDNEEALRRYVADFPIGPRVMLQDYVSFPGEAGVFYVREAGFERGRITSITLKHPPEVTGDGCRTLRTLILADPRAGRLPHIYLPRLTNRLDTVPVLGERVRLVFAGNHCKGSLFSDGGDHATEALTDAVDTFAHELPDYRFGRIDLRFESIAALRTGKFRVIEVNGVSSEPTHIWDPRTKLLDAWRSVLWHYDAAWRIGAANRDRGHRPPGVFALGRAWLREHRLMASYPLND